MSEVSVLSHEYKNAAVFSQRFNLALIHLKRIVYGYSDANVPEGERFASREELAVILEDILFFLDPQEGEQLESSASVPGAFIAQLQNESSEDSGELLGELESLVKKLQDPEMVISEEDLSFLDALAGAADAQTSRVFRRLMRK